MEKCQIMNQLKKNMSKTITVSDETYKIIKEQVESENVKEKTVKKFKIKNRFTEEVIYTSEKTNYKDVIEEAVKDGADLSEANLYGANLCGANLCGANLREADLHGANLCGANLYGARFYGKGGTTKIKKDQVNDFLTALGIVVSK